MINKIYKLILIIFLSTNCLKAYGVEQFNFDVKEITILENGNKFIGTNRGKITTNEGIEIEADRFEYIKDINLLNASGNVKVKDNLNNYIIYSKNLIYKKNDDIIFTKFNSRAISLEDKLEITADDFEYNRVKNIISAKKNVVLEDKIENYKIFSDFISYELDLEKIYTKGNTSGLIHSKYNFKSKDIIFLRNSNELFSKQNAIIKDGLNLYSINNFKYSIDKEELKGENFVITTNYNLPKSDKFYFSSAIVNLKNQNFIAKDTKIKIHKNIFDNSDNDPRLVGLSSTKDGQITKVNKGVFTSCKQNDDCPPWAIQAEEIIHDKEKKQLLYNNAILKIYDVPVLYFPKFFHPDPTVERQSGFLQPQLNKSTILGNSITVPYYFAISESKDFTINPTFIDSSSNSIQGEYRQENYKSSFIADFGFVNRFKSKYSNRKKNIMHLFAKSEIDLDLENFKDSELKFYVEKTNKNTYLKIFDNYLLKNEIKPKDQNVLSSGIDLKLRSEKFNLDTGFTAYEDLNKKDSDKYQFILPYLNFDTSVNNDFGRINFFSNGNNTLQNTNNLRTRIINDINFNSIDFLSSKTGFKSNFNIYLKNVNTVAKEDSVYKTSPQSEIMNIFEFNTSYPLIKETNLNIETFTPKASFRVNPGDMKNHTNTDRTINADNIFSINRLGIEDSLESGKSLTVGLNYEKNNLVNNNEINASLATVLRDNDEDPIPQKTTLNKKQSYLFGSVDFKTNDLVNLEYNFASDNKLQNLKYHDLGLNLSLNNFVTNFNFIEENDLMGSKHIIENKSTFNFDENNFISFKTRRNKEINLTEYYDLIYEYKNDCLIAGLKFKKTFYQDRDLEPSEDLFFYLTLVPLTTYEQRIDQQMYD